MQLKHLRAMQLSTAILTAPICVPASGSGGEKKTGWHPSKSLKIYQEIARIFVYTMVAESPLHAVFLISFS